MARDPNQPTPEDIAKLAEGVAALAAGDAEAAAAAWREAQAIQAAAEKDKPK